MRLEDARRWVHRYASELQRDEQSLEYKIGYKLAQIFKARPKLLTVLEKFFRWWASLKQPVRAVVGRRRSEGHHMRHSGHH